MDSEKQDKKSFFDLSRIGNRELPKRTLRLVVNGIVILYNTNQREAVGQ